MKLAVSYLKSNRSMVDTILKINETKADYLHADFMDGKYVKQNNIELMSWYNLRYSKKPIEVHLMVKNPLKYIKYLKGLNVRVVYIHYSSYLVNDIRKINRKGYKVGIVVNPDDDINIVGKYFKYVDDILLMSVYPGEGGQTFLPGTIKKLKEINKYRMTNHLHFNIEVDGGINQETVTKVCRYVDTVVSGSYVCKELDYNIPVNIIKNKKKV